MEKGSKILSFRRNAVIFYLISADHKTASFEMRENLYGQRKAIAAFWAGHSDLSDGPVTQKAALLVTCNRIEIYALASSLPEMQKKQTLIYSVCFIITLTYVPIILNFYVS